MLALIEEFNFDFLKNEEIKAKTDATDGSKAILNNDQNYDSASVELIDRVKTQFKVKYDLDFSV